MGNELTVCLQKENYQDIHLQKSGSSELKLKQLQTNAEAIRTCLSNDPMAQAQRLREDFEKFIQKYPEEDTAYPRTWFFSETPPSLTPPANQDTNVQECLKERYKLYSENDGLDFGEKFDENIKTIRACYGAFPQLLDWRLNLEREYTKTALGLLFFIRNGEENRAVQAQTFEEAHPHLYQPWEPKLPESELTYWDISSEVVECMVAVINTMTLGMPILLTYSERGKFAQHLALTRDLIYFHDEGVVYDDDFNFHIPKKNKLVGPKNLKEVQQWVKNFDFPPNVTRLLITFKQDGQNIYYLVPIETFPEPNPKDFEVCSWELKETTPHCKGMTLAPSFDKAREQYHHALRTIALLQGFHENKNIQVTINAKPAQLMNVQLL